MRAGDVVAGKYRLEARLGIGGMGDVWRAVHTGTERPYAIKLMHPSSADTRTARARFMREARASAKINHPNIIDVLDVGEVEDGALFMAMEVLDGISLADAFHAAPPLSVQDFLVIMYETASALAAAHAVGIIHRDIKPGNIYLHRDRGSGFATAKILDFGISKFETAEDSARTKAGSVLGSPRYMSPEQTRSASAVDHRADLWACGVILFEGLTGTWPHEGDSFSALVVAIVMQPPTSIDLMVPDVPEGIRSIVRDCLKPAGERLASAKELAARLAAALDDPALARMPLPRPLNPPGDNVKSTTGLRVRSPLSLTGSHPGDPVPVQTGSYRAAPAQPAPIAQQAPAPAQPAFTPSAAAPAQAPAPASAPAPRPLPRPGMATLVGGAIQPQAPRAFPAAPPPAPPAQAAQPWAQRAPPQPQAPAAHAPPQQLPPPTPPPQAPLDPARATMPGFGTPGPARGARGQTMPIQSMAQPQAAGALQTIQSAQMSPRVSAPAPEPVPTPAPSPAPAPTPTFGSAPVATPTFGGAPVATPTFGNAPVATPMFGSAPVATLTFGSAPVASPTFGNEPNAPPPYGSAPVASPTFGGEQNAPPRYVVEPAASQYEPPVNPLGGTFRLPNAAPLMQMQPHDPRAAPADGRAQWVDPRGSVPAPIPAPRFSATPDPLVGTGSQMGVETPGAGAPRESFHSPQQQWPAAQQPMAAFPPPAPPKPAGTSNKGLGVVAAILSVVLAGIAIALVATLRGASTTPPAAAGSGAPSAAPPEPAPTETASAAAPAPEPTAPDPSATAADTAAPEPPPAATASAAAASPTAAPRAAPRSTARPAAPRTPAAPQPKPAAGAAKKPATGKRP